jgi:TrpR family transcriptional regulator, trp operon repressor
MKSNYFNSLIDALLSLNTKKEMRDFLDGVLTPKERLEIPVRLEIIKLLKKGVPQHEIATKLGVGVATVTRGSKEIAKGNFSQITSTGWR